MINVLQDNTSKKGVYDMKEILAIIVVACIVIGCSETGISPKIKASAIPSTTSDTIVWNIVITIPNQSHSTAYFSQRQDRIGFWTFERKVNNQWVSVEKSEVCYLTQYPGGRFELPSGKTLHDSFTITQAGTYRIEYPFAWDKNETLMGGPLFDEFVAK
jgi:hypothetical protein